MKLFCFRAGFVVPARLEANTLVGLFISPLIFTSGGRIHRNQGCTASHHLNKGEPET